MMAQPVIKKLFKVGFFGSVGVGTIVLLEKNDWEVTTVGIFRFGRAAYVAAKIILDYKKTLHGLDSKSQEYELVKSELHLKSALRLKEVCCANGGAFIKVGQHLGSLDYLLPREYVETMKILYNEAPQSQLKDLFSVIKQDLGKEVNEIFSTFDPEPLGAASLAQVHKATLKDGTVVAVKVQHPRVKAHSFVDIRTMTFLIKGVKFIFPDFKYMWLAEETEKNLPLELDFLQEGKNCERMARLFRHFSFLKVPQIYWNLSSERVLTMEYCEGGKVNDRNYMQEHHISVDDISRKLGKLYSEMIFVEGYVHCDPHPGNVLVNKTSEGTEIVLLDHGLYQSLTDDFRVNYCKLWMAVINADLEGIKHYAQVMNAGNLYGLFACMLTARSWKAITTGIDKQAYTQDEGEVIKSNAANYFIEISNILNRVPRQMLLLFKTNDVLRSIENSLGTRASATSFINMARCCVQAVANNNLKNCDSNLCRLKTNLHTQWQLWRISLYELYLWAFSSIVGRLFVWKPALL